MGLYKAFKAPAARGCWPAAAAVALVAVALEAGGDTVRDALAWDRAALGAGQAWRLVSGHFVHLGWSHLLLNLVGLGLVVWLTGRAFDCLRWAAIGLASLAAMDAGFWLFNEELDWYVGLSGLLHGLLAAGLFAGILRKDREAVILTVFVVAKLGWEQFVGPLPGSESTSGGVVIVDAHLYGAAGGILGALPWWRRAQDAASL
jgi:rhomboid family GlyGly-CTERM serine protease